MYLYNTKMRTGKLSAFFYFVVPWFLGLPIAVEK